MKKITYFYLKGCPFCKKADQIIDELKKITKYKDIIIEKHDEEKEVELANSYDYYATPSMFIDDQKLYEATIYDTYDIIKENIIRVFEAALKS